jgi:hypothetical protein
MVKQLIVITDDILHVLMPIAMMTPQAGGVGWRGHATIAKRERHHVRAVLTAELRRTWYRDARVIRIERWAPRKLDTDNLVRAGKNIRDAVLDSLTGTSQGHLADGDDSGYDFVYAQVSGPAYGVCVTLYRDMAAHGPIERGQVWARG